MAVAVFAGPPTGFGTKHVLQLEAPDSFSASQHAHFQPEEVDAGAAGAIDIEKPTVAEGEEEAATAAGGAENELAENPPPAL